MAPIDDLITLAFNPTPIYTRENDTAATINVGGGKIILTIILNSRSPCGFVALSTRCRQLLPEDGSAKSITIKWCGDSITENEYLRQLQYERTQIRNHELGTSIRLLEGFIRGIDAEVVKLAQKRKQYEEKISNQQNSIVEMPDYLSADN